MKEFLSHHGVAFTDHRVDQDKEAFEELAARSGMRATPVIFVEDEMVVGFDRGRLEALLGIKK